MPKILSVVGNRPQFVKSAPLSLALRAAGIDEVVLHSGQHWDPEMSQVFFDELDLPRAALPARPAHRRPGRDDAADPRGRSSASGPTGCVVYGDTNTTLAGAHAAGEEVPVAHVEAGLRSFDLDDARGAEPHRGRPALRAAPLPRRALGASSSSAKACPGRREVVGDVMADATRLFAPIARRLERCRTRRRTSVLTIHREANVEPERLREIAAAVNETGRRFVFPIHPRTRRVLDEHRIALADSVELIEPLGYLEMLALVAGAEAVVTDSGGLQKEAYWLRCRA